VVAHLNSVVDTPELRAVYNELMPEVTVFFTEIGQDIELYERFKAIKQSPEFATLSPAQQTKLAHDLRGFVLSGAELPPEQQAELAALQTEAAQLSAQFSQNVLDATDAFALYFEDDSSLKGLPEDALAMFQAAAAAEGKTGYKIGLQMPHYIAVMQYADNRDLRVLLLQLYMKNNPKMEHQVFIYSFRGVLNAQANPFHYVYSAIPPSVRKSIVLQNLASGEMMQAFISSIRMEGGQMGWQIENTVIYANRSGVLMQIGLDGEKTAKTDKYRQFLNLAQSFMYQFQ